MSQSEASSCGKHVYWWNGEYEGDCELPEGHDGDHWDGRSWYDDDGNMTDHAHDGPPSRGQFVRCE